MKPRGSMRTTIMCCAGCDGGLRSVGHILTGDSEPACELPRVYADTAAKLLPGRFQYPPASGFDAVGTWRAGS